MDYPVIITVRSSSSRLPHKCYLPFGKYSMIEHVIRRALHYSLNPIVCTTNEVEDNRIIEISDSLNVLSYRGHIINKLLRWKNCCKKHDLKYFHTVDADDPFFCGEEVRRSLSLLKSGFDMITPSPSSSNGGCTVGFSLKSEIVERACEGLTSTTDTEMMWNFIKKVKGAKIIALNDPKEAIITDRMTLDYPEDYIMLKKIYSIVGNLASRSTIAEALKNNPDIAKINSFRNKEWLDNQRKKSV